MQCYSSSAAWSFEDDFRYLFYASPAPQLVQFKVDCGISSRGLPLALQK